MQSTFTELLNADNEVRRRAEEKIKTEHTANPAAFAQQLIAGLAKDSPQEVATLCCVLLKKYFLDARPNSEVQITELSDADATQLLQSVTDTFDFEAQPLMLLKRKGEVLAKLYSRLGQQTQFIQFLAQETAQPQEKRRQFAMYGFEIMSELHLTEEQMTSNKKDFQAIFSKMLVDDSIHVRTSALKAITAFISGIDNQDVVMEFEPILGLLIDTVSKAL